jgi:hypothetical protein
MIIKFFFILFVIVWWWVMKTAFSSVIRYDSWDLVLYSIHFFFLFWLFRFCANFCDPDYFFFHSFNFFVFWYSWIFLRIDSSFEVSFGILTEYWNISKRSFISLTILLLSSVVIDLKLFFWKIQFFNYIYLVSNYVLYSWSWTSVFLSERWKLSMLVSNIFYFLDAYITFSFLDFLLFCSLICKRYCSCELVLQSRMLWFADSECLLLSSYSICTLEKSDWCSNVEGSNESIRISEIQTFVLEDIKTVFDISLRSNITTSLILSLSIQTQSLIEELSLIHKKMILTIA